jgi:hypothetical protein
VLIYDNVPVAGARDFECPRRLQIQRSVLTT